MKKRLRRFVWKTVVFFVSLAALSSGVLLLWVATLKIPNLSAFETRRVSQSTKLYDRSGEVLLYDVHENVKRTVIPISETSEYIRQATVAIEDADFYEHKGIRLSSIIRAMLVNLEEKSFSQGGSTITQQVVKNALLTGDKSVSRKLKEWILAVKLEKVMSKEKILELYLNEIPYGGSVYGIEEASQAFFGKKAKDLSAAEAAYIAALPKAPTYYSPYNSNNRAALEERKNLVLRQMKGSGYLTEEEYKKAASAKVEFKPQENIGIKAPHFVVYVKEYLEDKYGEKAVDEGGLKVITTLDYKFQEKAQEIVERYALENEKNFRASNAGLIAIDPKTGQILAMVGSRNYFDDKIDGNFNVTLAHRQPGSAFKPFVYAEAFKKGYLPETVLFDLKTEFQSTCTPEHKPKSPRDNPDECYSPSNYDDKFRGPITLRTALASSINVPSVKLLYLAGLSDSIRQARSMGVESLEEGDRYGLTLVLGGGEVTLLELTSAYGVFSNNGIREPAAAILSIEDRRGQVLEEYRSRSVEVLPKNAALLINDILSDNEARSPTYGLNSPLYFRGRDVAAKTGTTNDYRDTWIVGYTPNIVIGAWAGNNDNSSMERRIAGLIVAPMWNAVMNEAIGRRPFETFEKPEPPDLKNVKPALKGMWQGSEVYVIDKISGKLATEETPEEAREERSVKNVHTILRWVDRDNPSGSPPGNPASDPQYENWEYAVREWIKASGFAEEDKNIIPTGYDDVHKPEFRPVLKIESLDPNKEYGQNEKITVKVVNTSRYPLVRAEFYLNGALVGSADREPLVFSFIPADLGLAGGGHELKVVIKDSALFKAEIVSQFRVRQ
ncbi:MAG: PBP1A family penicillin-binding protein [Candidatus Taylorbacteria bacterium]|nr:PBP1A family penicillin-binding protein [Candidatus Taylorbacteria bacterium]